EFILQERRNDLEAELLKEQIKLAKEQVITEQKQQCKLAAEFDLLQAQRIKAEAETGLLNQKTTTERAQTMSIGVDEDSIIGRQKRLYKAQTDGFHRDAEQKAAKILVDSWGIRRSTDEA